MDDCRASDIAVVAAIGAASINQPISYNLKIMAK
jgi:hypothetical protein